MFHHDLAGINFPLRRLVRIAAAAVILVIISVVQSCNELQRTLWGVTATATITRVKEPTTGEDGTRPGQFIAFTFNDDQGKPHYLKRTIHGFAPLGRDDTIDIIYIKGDPENAILIAERSVIWPVILAAMVAAGGIWILIEWLRIRAR